MMHRYANDAPADGGAVRKVDLGFVDLRRWPAVQVLEAWVAGKDVPDGAPGPPAEDEVRRQLRQRHLEKLGKGDARSKARAELAAESRARR